MESVTDTNWHHYAAVRSGNYLYLFLDGVNRGIRDVTGVTFNDSSSKMAIGRVGEYPYDYANGWIDEFRFSKGIARWTSNFTPPASEYVPVVTPTPTVAFTPTNTLTSTPTFTPTATFTPTNTPTITFTPTPTFTITPSLTNTFIPGTPHDNGSGICWKSGGAWSTYGVTYKIYLYMPISFTSSINAAAQAWSDITPSNFSLNQSELSSNIIKYEEPISGPDALAEVVVYPSSSTSPFSRATMTLSPNPPNPSDLSSPLTWDTNLPPASDAYSVQGAVTHEFGHFINLRDIIVTSMPGCNHVTMDGSISPGSVEEVSLETEDMNGLNWQYP